ncbi:MAG TPA: hypothetical protein VFI45_03970 [Candidatus Acidoferrum sp.]|nr:hypothetical protein [Candidatus Acidoferrum sp.]
MASASRMLLFVLLLAVAAILECTRLTSLRDVEIWGHLRMGSWILEHRSLPHFGLFSQADALPWRDYTSGYDCIVALIYRVAGLRALPALLVAFRFALAIVTFLLAGGWRNFWAAAGLSVIAQYVLFSMGLGAPFVSLLLFGVELFFLLEIRQSGNPQLLIALPALIFLWANLEIGFVYGIVLYAIFFAVLLLENWDQSESVHWFPRLKNEIPLQSAALTGGACLLASLLTPNTFHSYGGFFASELSPVNANLSSYHAMGFRQPQDYALMLFAMAAFLSLGLLRSRDLFQIGVLCGSTAAAFYSQRESWLLALASVAVIGHAILQRSGGAKLEYPLSRNWLRLVLPGFALASIFLAFAIRVPRNQDVLLAKVAEGLPVHAADFLRQHPMPPPFFNSYQWGGFLTWYLPEYPVAIDARRGLYPEEHELDYFKVMNAEIPYKVYPPLNRARTVLLDKAGLMGEAFRGVPGFQVVYEDDISILYSHDLKE